MDSNVPNTGDSGTNRARWAAVPGGGLGMAMQVSSATSTFKDVPTYVSSMSSEHTHWRVTGAASVFSPSRAGFRLYLPRGEWQYANKYGFDVNYLGCSGPVDCVLGPWEPWNECSVPCAGGVQNRTRPVNQDALNNGKACGAQLQHRKCNTFVCAPEPCKVSAWTDWTQCTLLCTDPSIVRKNPETGRMFLTNADAKSTGKPLTLAELEAGAVDYVGRQHRVRQVTREARYKGKECPALVENRTCNTSPCPPVDCKVGVEK